MPPVVALSPPFTLGFGFRPIGSRGLTYAYNEGWTIDVSRTLTFVEQGEVVLPDNSVNYIERTHAGVVSANTDGFTAGSVPMAVVVTANLRVTSVQDVRGIDDGYGGANGLSAGSAWYTGSGAPSDIIGVDNDLYLRGSNGHVYQKVSGSWADTGVVLKGADGVIGHDGADGAPGTDGDDGTNGAPGAAGADGKTILHGSGAPSTAAGVTGDFYINTDNYDFYGPKGTAWPSPVSIVNGPKGDTGDTGAPGAAGTDGTNGTNGTNGFTILSGTASPASTLGVNGDFYIDTDDHLIYGPKAAGAWGGSTSLVGPKGDTGDTGATGSTGATGNAGTNGTNGTNGSDGRTILSGAGVPNATLGQNGDFYLNVTSTELYGPKSSTATWGSPTSLIGPTGNTGSTGASGSNGTNGTNGFTILNGTAAPGTAVGVNGDFYIDTVLHVIYGPKASGTWPSGVNLTLTATDLTGLSYHVTDVTATSGTLSLNYALGPYFEATWTANITALNVTNWPSTGLMGVLHLDLKADGSARTLPSTIFGVASPMYNAATAPVNPGVANHVLALSFRSRDALTTLKVFTNAPNMS